MQRLKGANAEPVHPSTEEHAMRADDFVAIEAIGDLGRDLL